MININEQGYFRVKKPYAMDDNVYTVTAKGTIDSLLSIGLDVYRLVYQPAQVSPAEFERVVYTNPIILSLTNSEGNLTYIPEIAVIRVDHSEHIPYVKKAIVVNMGTHDREKTFQALQERIRDMALGMEGIRVSSSTHDISLVNNVTLDEHKGIVLARRNLVDSNYNISNQLSTATDTIAELRAQLRATIKFITVYLEECCNSDVCWDYDAATVEVVQYEETLDDYRNAELTGGNPFLGENNAFMSHLRHWSKSEIV